MESELLSLEQAQQLVYRAIDALNEQFPPDQQINKAPDTILVGEGGCLDSMGFVELAMQIQEIVLAECDLAISVADETLLGSANSPFRTVGRLVQHLARDLGEMSNAVERSRRRHYGGASRARPLPCRAFSGHRRPGRRV